MEDVPWGVYGPEAKKNLPLEPTAPILGKFYTKKLGNDLLSATVRLVWAQTTPNKKGIPWIKKEKPKPLKLQKFLKNKNRQLQVRAQIPCRS